ncbi:MAG: type II CAAX endopeptidase family protein [Verrucomicrobiota bacterium]
MDIPVEPSAWAIAFGVILFLAGTIRGLVWIIQKINEKQDIRSGLIQETGPSGLAQNLPEDFQPSWLEVVLLLFSAVACTYFLPLATPIVLIGGGVLMLRQRGVHVLKLWQWHTSEIGSYLVQGVDRYLVIFTPMLLLAAGSVLVFRVFGGQAEPQPVVLDFLAKENHREVLVLLLLAVVIAPVWEELAFRGILYPLLRGVRDRIFAVLVTGIIFGFVHGHGPAFIPLTFLGCALAWCYEQTGKLGYCIGLHAAFNAATSIYLLLIKYAPGG